MNWLYLLFCIFCINWSGYSIISGVRAVMQNRKTASYVWLTSFGVSCVLGSVLLIHWMSIQQFKG